MDIADVRANRGYRIAVGVGLASYGLIHLVIAWIAVRVATGDRGDASEKGALAQLAQQPLGGGLMWVMTIGLFTLAVWQVVEASVARDHDQRDGRLRRRALSVGRAVLYLALGVLTLGVARGSDSGSGSGAKEEAITAKLLGLPFGPALVIAVGVAVVAIGVDQIVKGVKETFTEDLDERVSQTIRRIGTIGYCAKGVALLIIGGLFGYAAITYDPDKAGGMDAALTTISDQPFGAVLLVIMAIGIACFGVYCFIWARKARY